MKTKSESIAMLPTDGNDEHEWCSVCGDDNVAVVVQGGSVRRGTTCHYCGNTVVLCSKRAAQMIHELAALNLGL
jgi:hypothetical protein